MNEWGVSYAVAGWLTVIAGALYAVVFHHIGYRQGKRDALRGPMPRGPFHDTITVHTAPSGTQYVDPLDLVFPPEELREAAHHTLKGEAS